MPRTPRQMHGRRAVVVAAAAGLLVSLFAPWYRETVVARGLHGLRTLTLTRSGWQAFSATELLIIVVAVLTLVLAVAVPSDAPEDGAPDRLRLSGMVIAALGAIVLAVVLVRLATSPGTTRHALDETMVATRWGIFLALACCAALTAAGLRLARAARQTARVAGAERRPRSERTPRHERMPRPRRVPGTDHQPRADRTPRDDRARRPDRAPATDRSHSAATHTDGGGSPGAAPSRQPDRIGPTRRTDRPLWDEQSSGWLDLPD